MKQEIDAKTIRQVTLILRYAYVIYLLLVIWLLIKGDYDWAVINLTLALAFNSFDTSVRWQQRPTYQKKGCCAILS